MDTWENRQAEIKAWKEKNASQRSTFVESFAHSDEDYSMDGQAVADFIDWLKYAYTRWPLETLTYIIGVAMDDKVYLQTLYAKAFTGTVDEAQEAPPITDPSYWRD